MTNDQNQFPDPANEFALQQAQLARRRQLAQSLIQSGMEGNSGSGYQGGKVYIVGNPLGNIASSIGGAYMGNKADTEQTDLAARQAQAQNDWQTQFNAADTPEAKQGLLTEARNRGLRYDLEKTFAEQEAKRIEEGEQKAADRVEKANEAEANRVERGEQLAQDRVSRSEDLKYRMTTPNVNVHVAGSKPAKPPVGYRWNEDGELAFIPGGPADPATKGDKPLNENQGNAVLYGSRASEAHKVLDTVGGNYNQMRIDMARGAENVPVVGSMVNFALGSNEQKVYQAQRDFINAVMRRESGATIMPSEFDNARKQYFPQPGDGEAVKAQKKANRELVIRGLAEVSGPSGKKAIESITNPTGASGISGSTESDPLGLRGGKK